MHIPSLNFDIILSFMEEHFTQTTITGVCSLKQSPRTKDSRIEPLINRAAFCTLAVWKHSVDNNYNNIQTTHTAILWPEQHVIVNEIR